MNDLLISVIVPVYKAEVCLAKCVASILDQTYRNLEVILIDDGSPDACPIMCDGYARVDDRVRVIHQVNQGQSKARNTALDICTGDVIAFVDSDDWLEQDAYEIMMRRMENDNLDIVFCAANVIKDGRKLEERFHYYKDGTICSADTIMRKCLTDEIGGQPWMKIYKADCFEGVRFPEGRIYEDLAISHMPFCRAKRVGFVDMPLYNYMLNPNGTSLGVNKLKAFYIFEAFLDHYEYARKECPEEVSKCLGNAAKAALSVYHATIQFPEVLVNTNVETANSFLKLHLYDIVKCEYISLSKKLAVIGCAKMRGMYSVFYRLYRQVLRK